MQQKGIIKKNSISSIGKPKMLWLETYSSLKPQTPILAKIISQIMYGSAAKGIDFINILNFELNFTWGWNEKIKGTIIEMIRILK